jgi:mRNA-degrading endonuclease RelE of RelBE toxin-antitoxin system
LVWRIELTATAAKQLGKLDKGEAKRIATFYANARRWQATHAALARP